MVFKLLFICLLIVDLEHSEIILVFLPFSVSILICVYICVYVCTYMQVWDQSSV